MADPRPRLVWFRRDLRLADNLALAAASEGGGPVLPVFVLDPETEAIGAAPRWRLGLSLADLAGRLEAMGSRLTLRRGPAAAALASLAAETGAGAVHWTRYYSPEAIARDTAVKEALAKAGIAATSHPGHVLHEPWTVATGAGGAFKVFTPFWRAIADREVAEPLPPPARLVPPAAWPSSDRLEDWRLGAAMNRGAAVVARHVRVGEAAAAARFDAFLAGPIADYATARDRPDRPGTSKLSENLTYGEISPRTAWTAGRRALAEGAPGAETFLRELAWRDFAWHLMFHNPHIATAPWRPDWQDFPWRGDNPDAELWRRGITGEPIVDAGLRELYVTGTMHNRVRMVVASFLCKHLLTHWRVGLDWFADCLVDWDPASNALGWQWVAGSGPDAAPFFRIFNPATQADRFDPDGAYRRRFLLNWDGGRPGREARAYFDAVPRAWGLDPTAPYPSPMIGLGEGRATALAAHARFTRERTASRAALPDQPPDPPAVNGPARPL